MVFLGTAPKKERHRFDVVYENILSRRSIMKYAPGNVSDELIERLIIAASFAPSAGNYQPWEFVIVRDNRTKELLVEAAYEQTWMLDAPVFIVAAINMRLATAIYGERGQKLYGPQAVGAAIQNILLAAHAAGFGTCWVGAFNEIKVSQILQLPDYIRPCAIITVGVPAEQPPAPRRQPLKEIMHNERFIGRIITHEE